MRLLSAKLGTGLRSQAGIIRGNLMVTILILLVLAALFFIPELLNLGKSVSGGDSSWFSSTPKKQTKVAAKSSFDESLRNLRPLDKVLYQMNNQVSFNSSDARASLSPEDPRFVAARTISKRSLSWETLESRSATKAFKNNRKELAILLREIDPKYVGTKTEIRNMINGIEYVMDGAENEMSAQDAVNYLTSLDRNIENMMVRERVERDSYMRWKQLSFGPLFRQTSLNRQKTLIPFRPSFTLGKVMVTHPAFEGKRIDPRKKPILYIEPYVRGQDVKEIIIYRNNQRLKKALASRSPNELGFRKVAIRHLPAYGVYRFEIYDHYGEVVIKSYEFYNKASVYPWNPETSQFQLPFGFGLKDKRLDRFFRLAPERNRGGTLLASFQSNNLFTVF